MQENLYENDSQQDSTQAKAECWLDPLSGNTDTPSVEIQIPPSGNTETPPAVEIRCKILLDPTVEIQYQSYNEAKENHNHVCI
jgi:hypothetical protein